MQRARTDTTLVIVEDLSGSYISDTGAEGRARCVRFSWKPTTCNERESRCSSPQFFLHQGHGEHRSVVTGRL